MVERMVESVKGEFNIEAKKIKTEIEKMMKLVTASTDDALVNNAVDAKKPEKESTKPELGKKPAQRNKRGSNKENNAVAQKTEDPAESKD